MPDPDQQPFCSWCGLLGRPLHWIIFDGMARRQVCTECRDKLKMLLDQHQPVPVPNARPAAAPPPPVEPRRRGRPVANKRTRPI